MQHADFAEVAAGAVASIGENSVVLSDADLLEPELVLDPFTGEPMVFEHSALAYSLNFEGNGSSAILSRVASGGRVLWSVTAQDAIGPIQWEGEPGFPIRWVEQTTPETLTVFVEVSSWYRSSEGDQWGVFGPYLVEIAAEDGAVLSARSLHIVEPE